MYTLSQEDVDTLKQVVRDWRQTRQRPRAQRDEELGTAAVTYIALTPAGGIPALTDHYAGDAAGHAGTGTGTLNRGPTDKPGYADCEIYRVVERDPTKGGYEIVSVGTVRRVFNLSRCIIPGQAWVTANKDAFGTWVADYMPCGVLPSVIHHTGTGTRGAGTGTRGGGGVGVLTACCPLDTTPRTLYATFTSATGDLAGLIGRTYTMTYVVFVGDDTWVSPTVCTHATNGLAIDLRLRCQGGPNSWSIIFGSLTATPSSLACHPFLATFTIPLNPGGCCGAGGAGTAQVVITETHP